MKISLNLTEAEIKEALKEYVKAKKGLQLNNVRIQYHSAGGDPRETSYYSATVSE